MAHFRGFFIRSKLSGHVLDIQGESTDPGTKVITWDHKGTGSTNQLWFSDRGTSTIRSKLDDSLCLTINDDGELVVDQYQQQENQHWMCRDDQVVSKDDHSRVLDICGASSEPGATICAYATHGGDNQKWTFELDGDCCYFYLKSQLSGGVLDVAGGDASPGTEVCMWAKHEDQSDNQLWYLDYKGILHSKLNNAVLDASGGGNMVLNPAEEGNAQQQWILKGDMIANLNNQSQVLDIIGGSADDGTRLCAYEVHGGDNQKWEVEAI